MSDHVVPTAEPAASPVPYPSAPPATEPAADGEWHRLSPKMLLVHPITEIGRALPALVGIFFAGGGARHGGEGHYWSLGAAGLVAIYSLTRWFTTRLRVTPTHIELRRGLLRRQTITTARDRIRTVDVTSHLLHRVLGLARVVVGTGINDRKGKGRITLDGLTAGSAGRLREELLRRGPRPAGATVHADGVPAPTSPAADGDPHARELAALDPRWIRYAPFTLSGVLTGLIIWGFFWRVQSESQVNLLRHGPLRPVTNWFIALPTATAAIVLSAGLVAFVAVTSTAGYVLSFWNFRLVRLDGGTVHVTRGLLTTRATSIERRRLAGIQLSEPLPLRWVGAARTTAIATGLQARRGSERGGEVLLPPAPRRRAVDIAQDVLDGSPAVTAELIPHAAVARRRRLVRAVAGALVLLAAALVGWLTGGSLWVVLAAAVCVAIAVPLGLDRYASLGHARRDGHLVVGTGSLVRRRAVLAEDAVIGWNLRTSVFQRWAGVTTLMATTAAGRQGYELLDIGVDEAAALAEAVTPGLLAQFLVPVDAR